MWRVRPHFIAPPRARTLVQELQDPHAARPAPDSRTALMNEHWLQTLLQQWAAIELLEAKPGNAILETLLREDADQWAAVLEKVRAGGGGGRGEGVCRGGRGCWGEYTLAKPCGAPFPTCRGHASTLAHARRHTHARMPSGVDI